MVEDLIDVLKLQPPQPEHASRHVDQPLALPPITGDIFVSEKTSVRELASLLAIKPYKVIADLKWNWAFLQAPVRCLILKLSLRCCGNMDTQQKDRHNYRAGSGCRVRAPVCIRQSLLGHR